MSESACGGANSYSTDTVKDSSVKSEYKYRDEFWLRHQYIDLKKSAKCIAREFDYGSTTINTWLSKHGIEKRSRGEQVSLSQNKDKIYHDEEWLRQKYHGENLTISEVAEEAGVSDGAVHRAMKRYGVSRRSSAGSKRKSGPWNDESWLREQYVDHEKSVPDIASEWDVSTAALYTRLDEFGIERRPTGTKGSKWYDGKDYTSKEYLQTEYVEKERSAVEIANENPVGPDTILRWLRKNGIKTRSRGHSSGEEHPCWKGGLASEYGSNWSRMRRKTRQRDNHICQCCGHEWQEGENRLDVHHIKPIKKFEEPEDANTFDNLITLCRSCHKKWEGIPLRPDKR